MTRGTPMTQEIPIRQWKKTIWWMFFPLTLPFSWGIFQPHLVALQDVSATAVQASQRGLWQESPEIKKDLWGILRDFDWNILRYWASHFGFKWFNYEVCNQTSTIEYWIYIRDSVIQLSFFSNICILIPSTIKYWEFTSQPSNIWI